MTAASVVSQLIESTTPSQMFYANLETARFDFSAYGATEAAAMAALKAGLQEHGRQCDLPSDWYDEWIADASVRPIQVGVAYRDGEPLPGKVR